MLSVFAFAMLSMFVAGQPQAATPPPDWSVYKFLLGEWVGEGKGTPGDTEGVAVFKLDLDGRVIVRTNHAKVAAAQGRPASVHDDLMVLYRESSDQPAKAIYWDNEGHTIEYDVAPAADGKSIVFVTRAQAGAPRFRLVYTKLDESRVDVKFEMAPPGNPEAFRTYTQGVTKRVK